LPAPKRVPPYTGSNPAVLEAQGRLGTGLDLHAKVIYRTCSPNGGVCHNSKEYPDLRTPASFLAAVGAPCNVQPGTPQAAYDRCERPGDRFQLGDGGAAREIGYLENIPGERQGKDPPTSTTPGLHIYLAEPIGPASDEIQAAGRFIRAFVAPGGNVEELAFASFTTRWTLLDGGKHLFGVVGTDSLTRVQELMTVGIVQGDLNRNSVFGARQAPPVPLLRPGKPEESYLIGRLRGVMSGGPVPGSRMPLANQPLSVPEMLALFCFVEGLDPAAARTGNLASTIDYAACSYSASPESLNLLGSGVTWAHRVKNILEFNCGGCHSGTAPQAGLNLKDGKVYARLLMPSLQRPDLPLIKPRAPGESYIWRKLTGDMITGARMPLNPLTGQGRLTDAELADIKTWIEAGAVEDQ
jgi:hypothetical protein